MKKSTRNILLSGIAVVLMLGIWGILILTDGSKEGAVADESHPLFTSTSDTLQRAEIKNQIASYTVHFNDDTPFTIGGYDLDIDRPAMNDMAGKVCTIIGRLLVDKEAKDLSIYSLENPQATVTLYAKDQTPYTFFIGGVVPGELGFYINPEGTKAVYVINSNMINPFLQSPYSYLTKSVLPTFGGQISNIALSGKGIDGQINLFGIQHETDGIGNTYEYRLHERNGVLAQPGLNSRFFSSLSGLNCYQIFMHNATADDLKKAGLDAPIKTIAFTVDGNSYTVKVGNFENDHYLVTLNDSKTIYMCQADSIPWMDADMQTLANAKSGIPAMKDLQSFSISGGGKSFDFAVSTDDSNRISLSCNGKELVYGNTENFYRFISLATGETYVTSYDKNSEVLCTMSFVKKDGAAHTIKFLKAGVRKVAFEINGECNFIMAQTYVDKILSDVEKVSEGKSTSLLLQ